MSTRCIIKIKRTDGTEEAIYCHHDGYIEGVGVTLQLAYNTADKVERLMKLGNLSSLGYFISYDDSPHLVNSTTSDTVCKAYHRDMGEELEHWYGGNGEEFTYTFYEEDAYWKVVSEEFHQCDTDAMKTLGIDYDWLCKEELLLDAIMKCDFSTGWTDDSFAKSGEVIEKCIEKAREARYETK